MQKRPLIPSHLSVCMSASTGRIFVKFYFGDFTEIRRGKLWLKSDKKEILYMNTSVSLRYLLELLMD